MIVLPVTLVIPTIPTRGPMLAEALESARDQKPCSFLHVLVEPSNGDPAPVVRDRALERVTTPWVAFLDDDDMLQPNHLFVLWETAAAQGADLVYPWYTVLGGTDPFPQHEGQAWDDSRPHQVPITWLARTSAVRAVGGFTDELVFGDDAGTDGEGHRAGEDYRLVLRMVDKGMKIVHAPVRTWTWRHWAKRDANGNWVTGNTMGLPSRVI